MCGIAGFADKDILDRWNPSSDAAGETNATLRQ